ncbi:hypothetical protein D9Q98_003392 [Chlorella vulgaris]|uniref:Uncharacterized protein n=1 Tax=Chlorella vulgaris TaxID=3077 RepID=A0A9D4TSJ1_CHLVU|nr:hypothetical protein D9Q98_003392 [Chlorella vulgaris]
MSQPPKAAPFGLGAAMTFLQWQLLLAALFVAWLLSKTSSSMLGNVPVALLAVIGLRFLCCQMDRQQRGSPLGAREARSWRQQAPPTTPAATFGVPPSAAKPDSWRKLVRAPVVEEAWSRFAGSIIQEFIYDTWYTSLTPDKEFPAEVRRLLNMAFARLAQRSRQLDLRLVLNDLSELFMEQLELYRDTRDSILLATQQPHCLRDMSQAARDRAFQREMKADNNLHPALLTPDGHYKFLRAVAEGAVAYLLDAPDQGRPTARVVCRELLSSCVFRPLMMYSVPYYYNKALYALLQETHQKRPGEHKEAEEISAVLAAARSESMRGHWEFEQRLLQHVAAEDSALQEARQLRHRLRSKLSTQHSRSRSVDTLSQLDLESQQQRQQAQQPQQQQQQQQQGEARVHPRARSCSPVSGPPARAAASTSPAPGRSKSAVGSGDAQREVLATGSSSRPRPPRPPAAEQPPPQQQQQEKQQQEAPAGGAKWALPQVLGGLLQARGRQPTAEAEAERAGLLAGNDDEAEGDGNGWESVETSEASHSNHTHAHTHTPPSAPRDFSTGHLLAPQADRAAVEGVTPQQVPTCSSDGGRGGGGPRSGFSGTPRAKVVAADLNTSSSKDFVEFKIRVADDAEEWTVSRRYRNFESLHRQLRMHSAYRLKLPPKRIFIHSNNVEFVEERREQLDRYLQLLLNSHLSQCPDLFEFLRQGSQLYELPSPLQHRLLASRRGSPGNSLQQRKGLSGLSRAALDGAAHGVSRSFTAASGVVAAPVKQVVGGVAVAAGAVSSAITSPLAPSSQGGVLRAHRVSLSMDGRSGSFTEEALSAAAAQGSTPSGSLQRDGMGSGLLSRAGSRLRIAMSKDTSVQQQQQQQQYQQLDPSGRSASPSSVDSEQLRHDGRAAISVSNSPAKKSSKLFSSLRRKESRSASPTKQPRERSPGRKPRRGAEAGGSLAGSRRGSGELLGQEVAAPESGGKGGGVPEHLASSLRSPSPGPTSPLVSYPVEPSLDMEDCAGVSDPLFECVDCLFQLQTRGYFRRQVFGAARQVLSLVAGEAIDQYLTAKLRLLRQQHTIGRIISQIQASLWPGGIWFQSTPAALAMAAAAAAAAQRQDAQQQVEQRQAGKHSGGATPVVPGSAGGGGGNGGRGSGYVRPAGMDADKFLEPSGAPPLDEDEIREAVEALLLRRAPSALVRLIGRSAYASGMQDMFDMLQSQTFCHHLGYGCLEVALVHCFPELKSLFRTLQHGGLG